MKKINDLQNDRFEFDTIFKDKNTLPDEIDRNLSYSPLSFDSPVTFFSDLPSDNQNDSNSSMLKNDKPLRIKFKLKKKGKYVNV